MNTSLLLTICLFVMGSAAAYFLLSGTVLARSGRRGLEGLGGEASTASRTVGGPTVSRRQALSHASREWRKFDYYRSLELALQRAGWRLLPVEYISAVLAAAVAAGALAWSLMPRLHGDAWDLVRMPGAVWGVIAFAAVIALAPAALTAARVRRMARFELSLPDALDLMAASLRSGHGFQRALQVTSEDMPRPVSDEFALAVQDISLGNSVEEALAGIYYRVPTYEMELITTAVGIQLQVGGNLSEILQKIAETLRERQRIKGEIATLTAEGKLSAIVVFLMPIALFAWLTNVGYLHDMLVDDFGHLLLLGAGLSEVIGMIILWKMVAMEV
ncbi:MAG TPA: type II secretion system F family protein [Armatimonadota bacterium]|jgi:tight adherence protein B